MRWNRCNLACGLTLALLPAGAAAQVPVPQSPIRHVIFLMKENRTFDNYFGRFPGAKGVRSGQSSQHGVVPLADMTDQPAEVNHNWRAAHTGWNNGAMNGFDRIGHGTDQFGRLMAYVQADQALFPNYWRLAQTLVLGNNFFSSVQSDSYANHIYTLSTRSPDNQPASLARPTAPMAATHRRERRSS